MTKLSALVASPFLLLAFSCLIWRESNAFSASPLPRALSARRHKSQLPPAMMVDGASVLLEDLGSSYSYCLDNFYFPTQSATGGIFSSVGDVIAQTTSSGNDKKYDPRRTLNYFLKGLGGGIMWACWFQFADNWSLDLTRKVLLDRFALEEPSPNIERATRTAISIILEQFLVCPVFYAFWDIPVPALLSGSPMRQIPSQIESKLGPLLVENAKVWTPLNLITYNIPLEFRILFTSCADILWQSINAGITSQEILVPQRSSIGASNMGASNATDASLTPAVEEAL